MVDILKLRGRMVEKGYTVARLADCLGINKSTLYRKLCTNGEMLTIREAGDIVSFLGLSEKDAATIFFTQNVACNANIEKETQE